MGDKVAVVTGSNKGIGFAVVKRLCLEFDGVVYMTARNQKLGQEALELLKKSLATQSKKCKSLEFHTLDITCWESISDLKKHLVDKYGGLDILVNNAAIAYEYQREPSTVPFPEQAEKTMDTNYFGTKHVCEILFPILRPHARVVNVSSGAGRLEIVPGEELRNRFLSENLTIDQLDCLALEFVGLAKKGQHKDHGYPDSAYGISKVAVTALTFLQQKQFDTDSRPDLIVNACCPGYVDTDMTGHQGKLSIDQGAETPAYLALLPANVKRPRGAFVTEKQEVNWLDCKPISL